MTTSQGTAIITLFLLVIVLLVGLSPIAKARISNPGSSSSGGITAFASSTIGNGTQTGGLTISGGATTTGNAYFGGTGTTTFISGQGLTMGSAFSLMGSTGKIGFGAAPPTTLASPVEIVSTGAGVVAVALTLGNASNAANSGSSLDFDIEPTIGAGNFFARITAIRTNVPVNTDTDLTFSTRGNSILTEAMRIKSSGNIGVGTSSPPTTLTIQGPMQAVIASGVATSTCTTAIEGSQLYNLGNHHLWLCMGTEPWTLVK